MEPLTRYEIASLVTTYPIGVVATIGPDGGPQATLVGLAITDRGEILFDSARDARKIANLTREPRVAIVVGGAVGGGEDARGERRADADGGGVRRDDLGEITLQAEGVADLLEGEDYGRCLAAYLATFTDGAIRAADADYVLVRVRLRWARVSEYSPVAEVQREARYDA